MKRIFTYFIAAVVLFSVSSVKVNAQNGCNCWPDRDTSFHPVHFANCTSECGAMTPPYYRNDDAATNAIVLPFNFCFWGKTEDTVFINTNGNITLGRNGGNFTSYLPDTFPQISSVVPPMIAPFWADVDLKGGSGGSDLILYKITAHYLIVQWDSVGYYDSRVDKLNSFEAIISDGTDPIIPKGNNVEFCYRTMQWTTGSASRGVNGFGGDPATVGANEGDGNKFVQIGLFANASGSYVGQFPPSPSYDGVAWLTNKSFLFNLCAGSISPLLSGVSPCDTFKVCEGDSIKIPFYFFSPIQGDSVWSSLTTPIPPGVSIYSNHPGHTDSLTVLVVGSAANVGYNTVNVYGYDNATPQDTTYTSFVIEVDSAPHIHLAVLHDTVCNGDTTTLTASGGLTYIWSPSGLTSSSIKVEPATTQTYTVGVSDGGCVKDTTVQVVVYPTIGPFTHTASLFCSGDSTLFTASISGATLYDWNFGDIASGARDSSLLQNTGHVYTHPGIFTVTLKAGNGSRCGYLDTTFSVTITLSPKPIIAGPDSTCVGTTVTLNVTGGTNYEWFPSGATGSSISISASSSQTYTVQASNGTCSHDTALTLTVVPDPTANIRTSKDSVCSGDSVTLEGSSGLKYRWSPGGQTTATIHIRPSSTVTEKLYTYASTCVDSTTITIPVIQPITATAGTSKDSICPGQTVTLTATTSGEQVTYLWSPGGATASSINVSPTITTTYTAAVTGLCNTVQDPVLVTVVPYPVPQVSGPDWACKGNRVTLTVKSSTNPTTYIWSNGSTNSSYTTGLIKADSTITVTAYNALGCSHDTTITITIRNPPTVTFNTPPVDCPGSSVTLTATATGSNPPFTYNWSSGETTSSITVNPTDDSTFIVSVSNGCKTSKGITVTPDIPNLNACCDKVILKGDDTTIVAIGDTSIKSYTWAPNVNCLNPPICDSVQVTPTITTTYTVTGKDTKGCETQRVVTITVEIPCFNFIIPNVFTPTYSGTLGVDNVFYIKTKNLDSWSLLIYDRWGKEMFNSTNPEEYWKGNTKGGGDAPAGVYYYVITATCQGTSYKKEGFVQLIR